VGINAVVAAWRGVAILLLGEGRMKTIIEMAREADPKANLSEPYCLDHETRAWLEAFAELVRADERERIIVANAPAIEKTNAHIKMLEDEIAVILARGQA